MAYFANGSEGSYLDQQCDKCLYDTELETACPVYTVQSLFNYGQTKEVEKLLNMLIDDSGTCLMRHALRDAGLLVKAESVDISDLEAWEASRAR